ncbi:MAG: SDR family NAD(P)-dependent oxidoreductase, partial [Actinomycetota bacterium]|nr:SDR family NAD(P)-dependent oxidoreductase [Actinomycetota bacterium]
PPPPPPLELTLALREELGRRHGLVVAITSDAAAEHYPSWGPYGATKAMLEHLLLTFGAESGLTTYVVDPGDMRTDMHQDAFPGEDISDRPTPESVLPGLLPLLEERPRPTGRYRAAELQPATKQRS